MKVIIAGSRDIADYEIVLLAISNANFDITSVVSGCARGIDKLGERFALECNLPFQRLYSFCSDQYLVGSGGAFAINFLAVDNRLV